MAKKAAKMTDTLELVKPYLERALKDEDFRKDLKDALGAARELYGPLAKQNGVSGSARTLATDKKAQEQMRRAIEDLMSAKDTLQGKKKKTHKGRNMVLLAGVIAGALYNPWTGPQTREKLLDMVAGNDDLQPLESFETTNGGASEAAADAVDATADKAKDVKDKAAKAAWDKLSYSHQRQHQLAIDGAKAADTRARRVAKTIEMLKA